MDWTQFALLALGFAGMYFSMRSDSRNDRQRHSDDRKDLLNMMRNFENDSKEFREKMASETKEFHGRMCTLEERYLQIITQRK